MNFKTFSILYFFVLPPALAGCGDGGNSPTAAAAQAPVNAAGTWRGNVNSTVSGLNTATLRLKQYSSNNTALSGTYAIKFKLYSSHNSGIGPYVMSDVSVPITGIIHGSTANFTITQTGPGCSGSFKGMGVITIFGNGVKSMGYSSSVASNAACVGNEIATGDLIFASSTTAK
jgi:hypothetical protein